MSYEKKNSTWHWHKGESGKMRTDARRDQRGKRKFKYQAIVRESADKNVSVHCTHVPLTSFIRAKNYVHDESTL